MKIGICQLDIAWENKDRNKKRISGLLSSVSNRKSIDWLIFPEFTLSGFSLNQDKTALSADDFSFFRQISKQEHVTVTFGGVWKNRNACFTFNAQGKQISRYDKIHLYSYGEENEVYDPGSQVSKFSVRQFKVSPFICYDLRFSYLFWGAAKRTDLFVVIANWPRERTHHWLTLLRARAIENQAFVIGVNRVGRTPEIRYSGNSCIFDPFGNEILNCGSKAGLYTADIRQKAVRQVRCDFPVFHDRKKAGI